jgi:hypothetical protein
MVWSAKTMDDGDDEDLAIPGDLLQGENPKLASLRAPLDA